MKNLLKVSTIALALCFCIVVSAKAADKYYYQIKVYHFKTATQEDRLDNYLQKAFLPAMHKMGIKNIGVFKLVTIDTADRKLYVFVPFKNMDDLEGVDKKLLKDEQYQNDGKDYIDAPSTDPPYSRIETVLLRAFDEAPIPVPPTLTANKTDRYYELRSYESATEKYHASKVKMFTIGGEVEIFKKINSNGVFYARVIAGSHMPNLMYLTTYNNKQDRDDHWKVFSANPEWKTLSAMPEYQKNVSKKRTDIFTPNRLFRFLRLYEGSKHEQRPHGGT